MDTRDKHAEMTDQQVLEHLHTVAIEMDKRLVEVERNIRDIKVFLLLLMIGLAMMAAHGLAMMVAHMIWRG